MPNSEKHRCPWSLTDPLLTEYHDKEWGLPLHQDNQLFEFLILEGAQAGLSWLTILRKRDNYRKAFDGFDPDRVAKFDDNRIESLMKDSGIIRNELKIRSAVKNAKSLQVVRREFGSFDEYIWKFVPDETGRRPLRYQSQIPVKSRQSDVMSKDLRKRGFGFVGSTICYSFMQAVGIVNDHLISCYRAKEVMNPY